MNTKNFFRFSALFAVALPLVACELLVDFDRTKIPAEDAGAVVDSGVSVGDATADAAAVDGATDGATAPDAIVPADAGSDSASASDGATAADGGSASDGAVVP